VGTDGGSGAGVPPVKGDEGGTDVSPMDYVAQPSPAVGSIGVGGAGISPVKGDPERILLKALEKNPARRYDSAAALADDIRRYLAGEPVSARPPGLLTTAVRWCVRHPVWTTTAACVLIAATTFATSFVAIWLANERPYRIVLAPDGSKARCFSWDGRPLHVWRGKHNDDVPFGEIVDRATAMGGRRLALVGFKEAVEPRFRDQLCAFDADGDLDTPLWTIGVALDDPVPDLHNRGYDGSQFHFHLALVADIFAELPGDEVVAVFQQQSSTQSIIRIHDLTGRLHYEIWHDAVLQSAYWAEPERLLVFAGINGTASYKDLGFDGLGTDHPKVVFAFRPRFGTVIHDYLSDLTGDRGSADGTAVPDGGSANAALKVGGEPDPLAPSTGPGTIAVAPIVGDEPDPLAPVWYLWFSPPEVLDRMRGKPPFLSAPDRRSQGGVVHVNVEATPQPAGVAWDLDALGREVPRSRVLNNPYTQNLKDHPQGDPERLPEADALTLSPQRPHRP
jgi:hypothetical protein